jgi:hypothetical protein
LKISFWGRFTIQLPQRTRLADYNFLIYLIQVLTLDILCVRLIAKRLLDEI